MYDISEGNSLRNWGREAKLLIRTRDDTICREMEWLIKAQIFRRLQYVKCEQKADSAKSFLILYKSFISVVLPSFFSCPLTIQLEQGHGTWLDLATDCLSLESVQSRPIQSQWGFFFGGGVTEYWILDWTFFSWLTLINWFWLRQLKIFHLGGSIHNFLVSFSELHPHPSKLKSVFPWTDMKINIDSHSASGEIWQEPIYCVIQHW